MKLLNKLFSKLIKTLGLITFFVLLALVFTTFGYKTANMQVKVADVTIKTIKPQLFTASIKWANGKVEQYELKGDQIYIDAKILKWKGWVGYLGIKTWYELDRIGGRYQSISDEQNKARSIYQLAYEKDYDLYQLRKKYPGLSFLVDAEYGSAVFLLADTSKKFQLYVARTGLTIQNEDGSDGSLELKIN